MCEKAVEVDTYTLQYLPDHLKMEEMCEKVVDKYPWSLKYIPNHHKTQGMCNEVVQKRSYLLEYVPDWFILQWQLKLLDNYKGFHNN